MRDGVARESDASRDLKDRGMYWSQHVLETPIAWMMFSTYVMATVVAGVPLLTGIASAAGLPAGHPATWGLLVGDGLIYIFCPQLCMLLLRLIQGRPLIHRLTGRTVVIGDVPWVCQAVDAMVSKLFACTYSATHLTVFSANPGDHLVHKMTHRVVRHRDQALNSFAYQKS